MNKSIWEWLEIEPTGEISEIRAAYARQVKKYHPEDTPEEFEQLQKAYKSALRQARAAKRMETVPQSVQESQKSGRGFEKRDMPGFFENAGMTEEPNVPSWEIQAVCPVLHQNREQHRIWKLPVRRMKLNLKLYLILNMILRKSERTNRSSSA